MCDAFHKSCYTSRSTGYKYRTLSTNTGDRRRRDSVEDSIYDRKFKELRRSILSRVTREVNAAQRARNAIQMKSDKVEAKIDSILSFQATVTRLRKDLRSAECTLANLVEIVDKLESSKSPSGVCSMPSSRSPFRELDPIGAVDEDTGSTATHL